jgi:hypothetical protein
MNDAKITKLPRKAPTAKAADRDSIPAEQYPMPMIPTKSNPPKFKQPPVKNPSKPSRPYKPSKAYMAQQNTI